MSSRNENNKKPTSDRPHIKKKRVCLMCSERFTSNHIGERICPSCKSTAAWREGDQAAWAQLLKFKRKVPTVLVE